MIDTITNSVIATISVGESPNGVAVNSASTRVYVGNRDSNNVSVIDTASNSVVATIAVEKNPFGVAVNPSGTLVYVTNFGTNNVSIIDTNTNSVVAAIPVGEIPTSVVLNPAGTRAYVANRVSNNVSVIDTASKSVIATITVGNDPYGLAMNPQGTRLYVSNSMSDNVSVIDTASNAVFANIPVGKGPNGVAGTPSGTRVYVVNSKSNNVSVIDTATYKVVATVPVGETPYAIGQFIIPPQAFTAWAGTVSFPLKLTTPIKDTSGNTKFHTSTETFDGTFKLYIGWDGPQPNEDGCYTSLSSNDGMTSICFKEVAVIATEAHKSKTDQLLLIGTGDSAKTIDGIPYKGNCYLDSKGTLKKNSSGDVISISLSGKIGGGTAPSFVFNGSIKTTLIKLTD